MNIKRPIESFTNLNTGDTIKKEKKINFHGTEPEGNLRK